jgi:hypothetical protein
MALLDKNNTIYAELHHRRQGNKEFNIFIITNQSIRHRCARFLEQNLYEFFDGKSQVASLPQKPPDS